jgi:preprotein translocase subunit YajC
MGANSNLFDLWPLALMFAAMYFLMIRPQQKRRKEQIEMLSALEEGQEVITSGGIFGKVISVDDNVVYLEIANNVVIMAQKAAIATLLPPGTMQAPGNLPPPSPSCCA